MRSRVWVSLLSFILVSSAVASAETNRNALGDRTLTSGNSVENGALDPDYLKASGTSRHNLRKAQEATAPKHNGGSLAIMRPVGPLSTMELQHLPRKLGRRVVELPDSRSTARSEYATYRHPENATANDHLNDTIVADDPAAGGSDQMLGLDKVQSNLIILSCVLSVGILLSLFQFMRGRRKKHALKKRQHLSSPAGGGGRQGSKVWDYPGPPSFKEVINVPTSSQAENDFGELNALATEVINRELLKESPRMETPSPQVTHGEKRAVKNGDLLSRQRLMDFCFQAKASSKKKP